MHTLMHRLTLVVTMKVRPDSFQPENRVELDINGQVH